MEKGFVLCGDFFSFVFNEKLCLHNDEPWAVRMFSRLAKTKYLVDFLSETVRMRPLKLHTMKTAIQLYPLCQFWWPLRFT